MLIVMDILNKSFVGYLKGIAIVLMIIHHSFGWPSWYVEAVSYPELLPYVNIINRFAGFAVVSFFLFLTGYAYYSRADKSYKFSFWKLLMFLVDYWIVYFTFLCIAYFYCNYKFNISNVILEMFAVQRDIMCFCWYVIMYIEILLFLPLMHKLLERYGTKKTVVVLLISFILIKIFCRWLSFLELRESFVFEALNRCFFKYMPIAIIGYMSAKYFWLEMLYDRIKVYGKSNIAALSLLLLIMYQFATKLNFVFVILYIVFMKVLLIHFDRIHGKVFTFLGKHSMNIWFGHCLFFSKATMEVFQQYAYLPRNPFLVVIWILFLCTCMSLIFTPVQDFVNKKISSLLVVNYKFCN